MKKTSNIFIVLGIILVSALLGGYYLGKQSTVKTTVKTTPQATQPQPTAATPSSEAEVIPSPTVKAVQKLTYNLPADWKALQDTSGRLEVGYDQAKYDTSTPAASRVELFGKWVGTGADTRRLGGSKYFYLTPYSGGSRHSELYKILGVTDETKNWKTATYSEREYSYNGWSCLAINGVEISAYGVTWGYCPVSPNESLVLSLDTNDWSEIEKQISAVRIVK